MGRKKIPDSEKITAVNLYLLGKASQAQFAEMYGVTKSSVQQWMRNFHIEHYNNKRLQRNLGVLTPFEKHQSYLQAA